MNTRDDPIQEALATKPELKNSPLFNMSEEEISRQYDALAPEERARLDMMFEFMDTINRGFMPVALTGEAAQLTAAKLAQAFATRPDWREVHDAVLAGRLFWLGNISFPDGRMMTERTRGMELFGEGLIHHPFGDKPYWIGLNHGTDEIRAGLLLCIMPHPDKTIDGDRVMDVFAYRYGRGKDGPARPELANVSEIFIGPTGDYQATGAEHDAASPLRQEPMASTLIFDFLAYALQLLNTDNVPVEKIAPSPKLQKARLRSGKLPLGGYYKVHTEDYVTILRTRGRSDGGETGKGTHASPIPHLRRGHRRYLDEARTRYTWVRDCMVGTRKTPIDDGDGPNRRFYDISKLQPSS